MARPEESSTNDAWASLTMTLHQRTTSNSVRIAIPGNHDAVQLDGRDRIAHSSVQHSKSSSTSYYQHERKSVPWQDAGESPAPSRSNRPPSGRFWVRLTRRQIVIILGSLLAVIVLLRQSATTSAQPGKNSDSVKAKKSNSKNQKSPLTPEGIPIVDRGVVFERIRQIEDENAFEDEDEDEARSAGRLPVKYNPARPPVYRIPDGKPRNRPKITEQDLEEYRQSHLLDTSLIDEEYCPGQPRGCKFLLPAWVGEQETKAQMHLYQLGLLSIALNRTLVLPNVSKSRMMTCASQPFEFYYDSEALNQLGIPTISFQRFTEWSSKRKDMPTSQIVAVTSPSNDWSGGALEVDASIEPSTIPSLPKRKLCLDPPKAHLNFTSFSPITIYPPSNWHKEIEMRHQFGESLINTLTSESVLRKSTRIFDTRGRLARWFGRPATKTQSPRTPDVLAFNYELRYPVLHHEQLQKLVSHSRHSVLHPNIMQLQEFRHFPYASMWTELAMQVVSSLSPFIAIHWRQETLPAEIIAPCGEALIDELERLLQSGPEYSQIKTVYLATDYPIEDLENGWDGAVAHSGTFGKLLTEEHHSAMRNFLTQFRERLNEPLDVRLTTFSNEQTKLKLSPELLKAISTTSSSENTRSSINDRNGRPRKKNVQLKISSSGLDLAELDIGLLGIIDKTVAMHAEVFLTGLPWSSARNVQAIACAKESSFTKQISEARVAKRSEALHAYGNGARHLWSKSLEI